MSRGPLFFRALPAYLGGKRRLCPVLFGLLGEAVERARWRGLTFLDPFMGGGSVSLCAKAVGLRVICNDLARRCAAVGQALIANSAVRLSQTDVAAILRKPRETYARLAEQEFCPTVFSREHAQLIDQALHLLRAGQIPEPRRSLLTLLLVKWILRLQPTSMLRGTDARAAAGEDYDRVSPRRVGHYLRSQELLAPAAWWALAREVNLGVFAGEGEAHQRDVFDFLTTVGGDIVYLDPPYAGTTAYEKEYAVLDRLLEGRTYDTSAFSSSASPLDDLFQACSRIPIWLVSLGNASMPKEELIGRVGRHRTIRRALEIPYRHLESIASEQKNAENKEYLILATD